MIGLVGCPGSGKSTFAATLAADVGASAIVVPMDGFHLAQRELLRRGRAEHKGAPDTFDALGYVELLTRLRRDADATVYAPAFDRHLEEPIAGSIAIEPRHTTIVTEGNYLLVDATPWSRVRELLDECWYVECEDSMRLARLTARHIAHGRTPEAAAEWVARVDEPNAALVRTTRERADRIVHPADHA
jgi:pantothenate kinase